MFNFKSQVIGISSKLSRNLILKTILHYLLKKLSSPIPWPWFNAIGQNFNQNLLSIVTPDRFWWQKTTLGVFLQLSITMDIFFILMNSLFSWLWTFCFFRSGQVEGLLIMWIQAWWKSGFHERYNVSHWIRAYDVSVR